MYNKTPFNSSPQRFLRIGWLQLSHTESHKNERYLPLCPFLDNVPVLAFEHPKSNEHHFLAVCCILNFILAASCRCSHSIFWRFPSPYCSNSSKSAVHTVTSLEIPCVHLITSYYVFRCIHISSPVMTRLKKVAVLLVVQKALAGIQKSGLSAAVICLRIL